MKAKIILASIVIVGALVFMTLSFVESNVEYADFQTAMSSQKKVQVKGEWIKDQPSEFDATQNQFIFYMKDDNNQAVQVHLTGAMPNNFEIATSVVVKGRYRDGAFYATECLTKCPSKYEGDAETMRKTL